MANIGSFTAQNGGFVGTVCTLTLKVKVTFVPNEPKTTDNAPDFRIVAPGGYDLGAAWKKGREAERPYLSVALDDPSFQSTIYASLIEEEGKAGTHKLLWSRRR